MTPSPALLANSRRALRCCGPLRLRGDEQDLKDAGVNVETADGAIPEAIRAGPLFGNPRHRLHSRLQLRANLPWLVLLAMYIYVQLAALEVSQLIVGEL